MSRTRTRERRKERERAKQRQRQTSIVIGIVAVAVVAVFLFIIASQPAEAPVSEEVLARYDGLAQSKTTEGFPVLGDPNAPVKVVEYSSFDCPHCREFHDQAVPALIDRVRAGDINFTYVPVYGTGGIPNGQGAARAAVCAGEQGAFWQYHDTLFNWQGTFANQAFSQNRLASGVSTLGLNQDTWNTCMSGTLPDTVITAALTSAQSLGDSFQGTPTILVNGAVSALDLSAINTAIDTALAAAPRPEATVETTAEATAEATMEATAEATMEATAEATVEATVEAMVEATAEATMEATAEVTVEPTSTPTVRPTTRPTIRPTIRPTTRPTLTPTTQPTVEATAEVTATP